jgi:hypothetical protein
VWGDGDGAVTFQRPADTAERLIGRIVRKGTIWPIEALDAR